MRVAARPRSRPPLVLHAAYQAGRAAWPRLDLPVEAFVTGLDPAVAPRHPEDLYLARACDAGLPGAWEHLRLRHEGPLGGFLRKRGASADDMRVLLDEVWGTLAAPPPRGGAATRIGTYDGRGALRSWLATVLWRRLADRWRARGGAAETLHPERTAGPPAQDPAHAAGEREAAARVAGALEAAWGSLTARELEAIVLKYRHRLPQTEVARILRVGPPRVTRLLKGATRRLRRALEDRLGRTAGSGGAAAGWADLQASLARVLARTDAALPARGEEDHHG